MKIIIDRGCESYPLIGHLADQEFYDFDSHTLVPNAVYIFSRQTAANYGVRIKDLISKKLIYVVVANAAEGSETLYAQFLVAGLHELAVEHKILVIGGAPVAGYRCLSIDHFLIEIHNYEENIQVKSRTPEIFEKVNKPYSFLFLNGRLRHHRQWLIKKLRLEGLLDQALWTCLTVDGLNHRSLTLMHEGRDLLDGNEGIKLLPVEYEVDRYKSFQRLPPPNKLNYTKTEIFNNEWGEIYINPLAYIDTYFSLVSETVFDTQDSFRTEKIWKPIVMGHPWIVAANTGYYRDIKNMGFKTFSHVINEKFDDEPHPLRRLEKLFLSVKEIVEGDRQSFLSACQGEVLHNQSLAAELAEKYAKEFPARFVDFLETNVPALY